jgi:hypothetical protein
VSDCGVEGSGGFGSEVNCMRSFDCVLLSFVEKNSAQDDRWMEVLYVEEWFNKES